MSCGITGNKQVVKTNINKRLSSIRFAYYLDNHVLDFDKYFDSSCQTNLNLTMSNIRQPGCVFLKRGKRVIKRNPYRM